MADPPLACTVRDCGLPLSRNERSWACPRGHSFDVARSGYINLLQPQDRHSPSPGDSRQAIEARADLVAAGVGRTVIDGFADAAAALDLAEGDAVADLGSGSGEALARLAESRSIRAVGIDLSTAAAEHAARRFPSITWVVANADRRLPLLDNSVRLLLSLNGRRNPVEAARVLKRDGHLLVGAPARDDLAELREVVQGARVERDRTAGVIAEHSPLFELREQRTIRERHALDPEDLLKLLRATYRGERQSAADRARTLTRLEVTLALDVLVFAPKS